MSVIAAVRCLLRCKLYACMTPIMTRMHCSSSQELYRWPKVAEAARYALNIRYALLPYLYSAFRVTASHGCPLARPLMLGWPADPAAVGVDRQWTMGDAVLITPVMEQVYL